MPDLPPPTPYEPELPSPWTFRPTAVIAWAVIVGVCALLLTIHLWRPAVRQATTAPAPTVDFQSLVAGRYAVGVSKLFSESNKVMEEFAGAMPPTPEGKLAGAVVAGESQGGDAAVKQLDALNDPDARTLAAVYSNAATRPDLEALRPRLGWFAGLAESYGKPDADPHRAAVLGEAKKTVYTLVGALAIIVAAGVAGLSLFVTAVVLLSTGRLRFAVGRPVGPGYVYVETVAIYLGGFIAVSFGIGALMPDAGLAARLAAQGGVVVLAAVWPLLRGVPWTALRQDWGVHTGRNFFVEVLAGAGGYLAGLPVLLAGVSLTLVLTRWSGANVTHPIANEITTSPPLMLFGLAAVFAPLTEELIFRGALVSHLRGRLGVVATALLSGLVFAAVHPQGWAAIPTIGGIGAVLALVRQWRGSLVASITAHAINNGFVVALLTLATR